MLQKLVSLPLGPEAAPFLWLLQELEEGRQGALLTVTAIDGSAPRPVGTQMAVVSAERYQGYLSGGCVEPAIALEVELFIKNGHDRILRFGRGSPFFDVRFPCGGGIDVRAHLLKLYPRHAIPLRSYCQFLGEIAVRRKTAEDEQDSFGASANNC